MIGQFQSRIESTNREVFGIWYLGRQNVEAISTFHIDSEEGLIQDGFCKAYLSSLHSDVRFGITIHHLLEPGMMEERPPSREWRWHDPIALCPSGTCRHRLPLKAGGNPLSQHMADAVHELTVVHTSKRLGKIALTLTFRTKTTLGTVFGNTLARCLCGLGQSSRMRNRTLNPFFGFLLSHCPFS